MDNVPGQESVVLNFTGKTPSKACLVSFEVLQELL
jgi:hypothetical protein